MICNGTGPSTSRDGSMKFSKMRLGTKLIGAFVLVYLIDAVVSGIGIRNMAQINDEGDKVYHLDPIGLSLTQRATLMC
jgi:Four helix bundle sensory module for signal transduction